MRSFLVLLILIICCIHFAWSENEPVRNKRAAAQRACTGRWCNRRNSYGYNKRFKLREDDFRESWGEPDDYDYEAEKTDNDEFKDIFDKVNKYDDNEEDYHDDSDDDDSDDDDDSYDDNGDDYDEGNDVSYSDDDYTDDDYGDLYNDDLGDYSDTDFGTEDEEFGDDDYKEKGDDSDEYEDYEDEDDEDDEDDNEGQDEDCEGNRKNRKEEDEDDDYDFDDEENERKRKMKKDNKKENKDDVWDDNEEVYEKDMKKEMEDITREKDNKNDGGNLTKDKKKVEENVDDVWDGSFDEVVQAFDKIFGKTIAESRRKTRRDLDSNIEKEIKQDKTRKLEQKNSLSSDNDTMENADKAYKTPQEDPVVTEIEQKVDQIERNPFQLNVQPDVKEVNSKTLEDLPHYFRPCSPKMKYVCFNGGKCVYRNDPYNPIITCWCPKHFYGNRCESFSIEYIN